MDIRTFGFHGKNTNVDQKIFLTDLKSFIVCFYFWSVFSTNIFFGKTTLRVKQGNVGSLP